MKKALFVFYIAIASLCSSFVYLIDRGTSLLASVKTFVRERIVMLATFAGFCLMSLTASAAELAEGITFFSVLTETWALLPWYAQVIGVLWLLVPVFSFIVAATDTPKDDNLWGKWIYPIIEKLALVVFKSKEKPGDYLLTKWR